jgi:hypothetical protein
MGLTINTDLKVSPAGTSQSNPDYNAFLGLLMALYGNFKMQTSDTYGALSTIEFLNALTQEDNATVTADKEQLQQDEAQLQAVNNGSDPAAIQAAQQQYNQDVNKYNIDQQQASTDNSSMQNAFYTHVSADKTASQATYKEFGVVLSSYIRTENT